MQDINSVTIVGRLVKDATTKTVAENFQVLEFSIAVNTTKKVDGKFVDEGNFFNVKVKGKSFDNFVPFLKKGKQVAVKGTLRQDRWEKDGQKNSIVYILGDTVGGVQLVGGGKSEGDQPAPESFQGDFPEDIPF